MNHHQDFGKILWSVVWTSIDAKRNTKQNKGNDYTSPDE